VALQPKPVIVPQVGPQVARRRGAPSRIQREVMRVFMRQRGFVRIPQAQEGFVERVASGSAAGWARTHGTAPGPIPVDVVAQRIGHEQVDRAPRQKFLGDFGISLLPEISAFKHADVETNSAGGEFAGRLFLPLCAPLSNIACTAMVRGHRG
jgi:hypothetical protein